MEKYGIAIAAVGKGRIRPKIVCNLCSTDEQGNVAVVKGFTFPINLQDKASVVECFIQFADMVDECVKLQKDIFAKHGRKLEPAMIIWGKSTDRTYETNAIPRFIINDSHNAKNWKPAQVEAYKKLGEALKDCIVSYADYEPKHIDPADLVQLEAGKSGKNSWLLDAKKTFDETPEAAIEALCEFAVIIAKELAQDLKQSGNTGGRLRFLQGIRPYSDFWERPDLQALYPIFCFTKWDPRIEKVFVDTLRTELDIKGCFFYKSAADKPLPPLVNILAAEIMDSFIEIESKSFLEEDKSFLIELAAEFTVFGQLQR